MVTRFVVPLIYNLEFTTNMSYTPYTRLKDLIKPENFNYFKNSTEKSYFVDQSKLRKFKEQN